ncbi:MAG: nucleotidyltransferase family protein [Bacteroidales bacterium]|nr:nucleotidyltransferase family protein [Bacteroidales bacterium]
MESIAQAPLRDIEAIVLAGGKGTRLQPVVADLPKPMADIGGKPFLCYLLHRLAEAGIRRCILATGYRHADIENFFGRKFDDMELDYAVESRPLGTGGGIANALRKVHSQHVLVCNGDTFYAADLARLQQMHQQTGAAVTMILRPMADGRRYGTVACRGLYVSRFIEKSPRTTGACLINGGIYLIDKGRLTELMEALDLPESFSFEQDVLPVLPPRAIAGYPDDGFFIDIGIPEDYAAACRLLPTFPNT